MCNSRYDNGIQLSDRFLTFADQQLAPQIRDGFTRHLGLYVSAPPDTDGPPLVLIRQWGSGDRSLMPADADPDLRTADALRRWFPLQDAGLILGALRVDLDPRTNWTSSLDAQMRRCSESISHALGRDLECQQLQGELTRQNQQLRTLVHQLRNPLAALRTYAQLLMRRLDPDSAHQALLSNMLIEQQQLDRYIDAIDALGQQALPRSDDAFIGPTLLPPARTNATDSLATLIQPLVQRAEATANLQNRPWRSPSHWPTWSEQAAGDGSIAEIVANLLENAFRYSPTGCSIGLELLDDGLCVWDAGPPIPRSEQERIFERGERGSAAEDRPGTGLGLALARHLAERNGARLSLSTDPRSIHPALPAEGNAFRLSWSRAALPAAEA